MAVVERLETMCLKLREEMRSKHRPVRVEESFGTYNVLFLDMQSIEDVTHYICARATRNGAVRVSTGPNLNFAKYFDGQPPELSANIASATLIVSAFAQCMYMTATDIKMPDRIEGTVEFTVDASEIERGLFSMMRTMAWDYTVADRNYDTRGNKNY